MVSYKLVKQAVPLGGFIILASATLFFLHQLAKYAGYIAGSAENAFRSRLIASMEREMNRHVLKGDEKACS